MALALSALVIILILLAVKPLMKWTRIIYFARRLPGPTTIPLLGNILDAIVPAEDFVEHFYKMFVQYKFATFWFGPLPIVVVYNPQHVKILLGDSKQITKPFLIKLTVLGKGLAGDPDNIWKVHRKMIEPTFDVKILKKFTEVFCLKSESLVKKLEKHADGRRINIQNYIFKCTLDAILETALGSESNTLDVEDDTEFERIMQLSLQHQFDRMRKPWLYPDFIFYNTERGRIVKRSVEMLDELGKRAIREKKEVCVQTTEIGKRHKLSFVELLLHASLNEKKLTHSEVLDEFRTLILAGHDSTALTICWTLQELGNRPAVQERVQEELDSIFHGSDRAPTMEDLSDMKYLEMVLKENLRLNPTVPVIARVLTQDIELDGYTLPAGIIVTIPWYLVHRHEESYPNPENFDPDNFLTEKEAERSRYAWGAFSCGPRKCIGQKYAVLELKIILSYILRYYEVRSEKQKLKQVPQISLGSPEGFPMSISRRIPQNSNRTA